LRINGKEFEEAFNRYLDIDLNLILYVMKFLKRKPETAAKEVFYKRYALYSAQRKAFISEQKNFLPTLEEFDVLDLVFNKFNCTDTEAKPLPNRTYVHNPLGVFHVKYLNNYILDYHLCEKGKSLEILQKRLSWKTIKRIWI
jgi:hypothetical protein